MSNTQRAVWTFLIYALVAPFFAGLAIAIVVALGPLVGLGGLFADGVPPLGPAALTAFAWSIPPAIACGLVLALVTGFYGSFSWVTAAVVAIFAFTIAAVVFPIGLDDARPYLAFLAGLVGVAVRQALVRSPILSD